MSRIVVGVDGSPTGLQALRWALQEASQRGWPVVAVHAYTGYYFWTRYLPAGPLVDLARAADEVLREQLELALNSAYDVKVETVVAEGNPARLLIETALPDDLLVVGSRGHGGFPGLLLGSTSQHVANHADCSVVIVRQPAAA